MKFDCQGTAVTLTESQLAERLNEFGQHHLVTHLAQLEPEAAGRLRNQLAGIDLELIQRLAGSDGAEGKREFAVKAERARPPQAMRLDPAQTPPFPLAEAIARGEQALAAGEVGMILVAGGQGTRLGFDQPKGMFPLGPLSQRTLFQLILEKLAARIEHHGGAIPLWVMTSPATDQSTRQFLDRHRWFGLSTADCQVFCQGTMPAVDAETGQLLLDAPDALFASPDGHGGMLAALDSSGAIDEFNRRGIRHLFYCQVDNPMSQICDPLTIGYHILCQSELTAQAARKVRPLQKVGNIVEVDGRTQIIEYSDLPEQVARKTNADGSLWLWAGNIAVHVFDVSFLERMKDHADALPFHLASKKVPFLDATGTRVEPDKPNAIKFERFIFDLLPMARQSIVIEVDAKDAFAPVKNAASEPTETARTAQQAMMDQARRWLRQVGIEIDDGVAVEINPLFAIDAHQLAEKIDPAIERITESTYLR